MPAGNRATSTAPLRNVFPTEGGVAILLTSGPNRDWLKNIVSAGRGRMRRCGKTIEFTDPPVMPKSQAAPLINGL
jgi:hypothetical protein